MADEEIVDIAVEIALDDTVNRVVMEILEEMDDIREKIPDSNYINICQRLQVLHGRSARQIPRESRDYCSCMLL